MKYRESDVLCHAPWKTGKAANKATDAAKGVWLFTKGTGREVGVNLRTLQEYDNRAMDINRATGGTLTALSKVLGCQMEDLLEYDYAEVTEE